MRVPTFSLGLTTLVLSACVFDAQGTGVDVAPGSGGASSSTATSSSAGGKGGATSSSTTSSGGGHGGAPMATDPTPEGAVSFFTSTTCPAGWSPFMPAAGRLLLPAIGAATAGTLHGSPLGDGEDRGHSHALDLTFAVDGMSIIIAGGSNDSIAAAGTVPMSTTSEAGSTGLPYVQLLVCKKTASAGTGTLPAGMHLFVEGTQCPDGFQQAADSSGRFLVGLPDGATPDVSFGGAPLASSEVRTHSHDVSASLMTQQGGLAAACGCCNSGFASGDTFQASGDSDAADPALPYVELLQCVKM